MSSKKKPIMGEELYFGYLLKSPPPASLTKNAKLWKHYFFVLSKTSEDSYQLTYHANHERRDKTLRAIDIAKIILFFIGPESHPKWEWIQKNFKCPPSSVLFLKVEEDTTKSSRDYFLIGENSDDVNGWFSALFEVIKIQQSRNTLQGSISKSLSGRLDFSKFKNRWSAFDIPYPSRYRNDDHPRKLSEPPIPVIENTDEKDGNQDESPKKSSIYMSMTSVEDHNLSEHSVSLTGNCASARLDNRLSGFEQMMGASEDSLLDCVTKAFNDMKTPETSTESDEQSEDHRNFNQSVSVTGRCASTELDNSVSQWRQIQDSRADWILQNAVEGIHKCLKTLSRDEAKLLLQQFPGLDVYDTEDKIQNLVQILSPPAKQ